MQWKLNNSTRIITTLRDPLVIYQALTVTHFFPASISASVFRALCLEVDIFLLLMVPVYCKRAIYLQTSFLFFIWGSNESEKEGDDENLNGRVTLSSPLDYFTTVSIKRHQVCLRQRRERFFEGRWWRRQKNSKSKLICISCSRPQRYTLKNKKEGP